MARSIVAPANNITAPATAVNFGVAQPFSVSVWFNPTSLSGNDQAIVGHLDTAANFRGWELNMAGTSVPPNNLQFFLIDSFSGSAIQKQSSFAPSANQWVHFVVTYSGSALASGVNLYANGVLANGSVSVDTGPVTTTNAISVLFGQRNNGSSPLSASLADVAIWNTVLSAGEVLGIFRGERPYTIRSSTIKAYWPLDGLASPEPDLSGNAANGTLTGTALAAGPPVSMFTPRWPLIIPGVPVAAASSVVFRRTLSTLGTRTGSRQPIGVT